MIPDVDYSIDDLADEYQKELYKKFSTTHFLSNPNNMDHFFRWNTFFRKNYHRFSEDFLGIKLYEFQAYALYKMGISNHIFIVAARAASKSFMIALYACIRCILYPNTKILLSSATKGQSELIITEKIQGELMIWSPMLAREIESIKNNQNKTVVRFRNHSQINVVVANPNARGNRSNVICREECRMIDKNIDDSVLSPCQVLRQSPYMLREPYKNMSELKEDPVDIYITSSWIDGHWMWNIFDTYYDDMNNNKSSCVLAFDESVILKHNIKSQKQLISERRKQDKITFNLEFLNLRLRENTAAYFTYSMLQQNQKPMQLFYPRTTIDFKSNKKNPYDIPKQKNEIRIISVDMAFVTKKGNDNSVFSCMRGLPESTTYNKPDGEELEISSSFRRSVPYLESTPGGDGLKQARRIRQLYEDFSADYIVLDARNGGAIIYDLLANIMYDEERGIEYSPLSCMNDESYRDRVKIDGAKECIYIINATQKLNSEIAEDFRRVLENKKIDLPVNFEMAKEDILPNIKEYINSPDASTQIFYETPFLETQALISETTGLLYERKVQTGAIVISEPSGATKDRYTSVSYGSYFFSKMEMDGLANNEEYEYTVIVN